MEPILNKLITKMGLKDNIAIRVKDIEEQEKVLIYNMADIVMYPAVEFVAIDPPLSLLEAMACAR